MLLQREGTGVIRIKSGTSAVQACGTSRLRTLRRRRTERAGHDAVRERRSRAKSVAATTTAAAAIAAIAVGIDSGSSVTRAIAIHESPQTIARLGATRPPVRSARSD